VRSHQIARGDIGFEVYKDNEEVLEDSEGKKALGMLLKADC
jgi:hypothetical protein